MDRTANEVLASVVREAGVSNKALAKEVRDLGRERGLAISCTHVDVARWLAGMRPRGIKPQLIACALGRRVGRPLSLADIGMAGAEVPLTLGLEFSADPPAILRTTRTLWSEDLDRADFLRHGAVSAAMLVSPMGRWLVTPLPENTPLRTGRAMTVASDDVDAVRATLRMFEDLDHRYGGGHARTAAVQYLHSEVAPLLHAGYTDRVGRDLFAVASQFTYKTGAMAYDVGMHGLARRYFVQALNLAQAAGDRALGGKVLALMSHQANFLGEYAEAADLARAAKLGAKGHATATAHAMYCAMEGRALASLGDRPGCLRALREAESSFARRDVAQDPDWIAYFDEAELHDEFGHCFAALRQTRDAVEHADLCLRRSDEGYVRSRTFCRITLASAHLGRRDVEQACSVAAQALDLVGRIKSSRVRSYIQVFDRKLEPFAELCEVAAFRERLHAA